MGTNGHFSACPVSPRASPLLLPTGPGAPFQLSLNSVPELCCRCSRLWVYLPDGSQTYPVNSLPPGPLGSYGSASLTDFGLTLLPSFQFCFWPGFLLLLMGLPGWTLDMVHCLPYQGLPMHPVTSSWSYLQKKTHFGTCLVFLHRRSSVPLIQGLKEKVNSLITIFKGSLHCLPSRYRSTPGV